MELLILLAIVVVGVVAWMNRVKIAAKVLGQPEARVRRAIERRKGGR